ncbi:MAG: type IV pilus assembly protein PilM [Planctomycetes bacterium]|nr:type IV pilus assembly protein PilM [Planctomycetota bacterium]
MDTSYPEAWGLDIGAASIKAVKLRRVGERVTVLGYAIEPVTMSEGKEREQAVSEALEAIVSREEFGETPVFAAISGRLAFTRAVNVPVISPKRMRQMVEVEARQQIPGDFNEVEWGFHSSPAADGSLDVALFAVKKEIIQQLIAKCKAVGINLAGVSLPSLALYNFIKYDQDFPEDEAVVILDVGAENTELVVYFGDRLWMRSLPVSGNDLTQVFAKKFRVSVEEAEKLKRQVTDSRQADKIIKLIESGLNDLVSEVNRSLGFYRNQNPDAKLDNIVISGNTFRLPGLPEYMAEKLGLTVNILEDLDRIKMADGLDRTHFMQDLQSLGVAMGLALQATGVARANVNLMPTVLQAERVLASKRWAAIAALAVVAVAAGIDWMLVNSVAESNRALAEKVTRYARDNQERMQASKRVLERVQELAPQLAAFDVVGSGQGLTYAAIAGALAVVQEVATQPSLRPPPPTRSELAATTPPLQGAYLRRVTVGDAGRATESDPLRPLAQERTITIEIDIPSSPRQGEVRSLLLRRLRELPRPEYLADLMPGRATLFSDVQATSDRPDQVSWFYIDRDHIDERGQLRPIEERKSLPVSITTFVCKIAASGTTEAATGGAP